MRGAPPLYIALRMLCLQAFFLASPCDWWREFPAHPHLSTCVRFANQCNLNKQGGAHSLTATATLAHKGTCHSVPAHLSLSLAGTRLALPHWRCLRTIHTLLAGARLASLSLFTACRSPACAALRCFAPHTLAAHTRTAPPLPNTLLSDVWVQLTSNKERSSYSPTVSLFGSVFSELTIIWTRARWDRPPLNTSSIWSRVVSSGTVTS